MADSSEGGPTSSIMATNQVPFYCFMKDIYCIYFSFEVKFELSAFVRDQILTAISRETVVLQKGVCVMPESF